ncbi:Acyl-CoA dehydrogenase, short-chain specific [hydrothermal vent metagenome]|uniref:Acyl-CoA dehydrogenase, short-chain specific n=1 Tax=hydrothermal vent metagenome TaxID=652676 RepID=A0A3B0ZUB0_9ZZZZ
MPIHESINSDDFKTLKTKIHKIGREIIALHAHDVDSKARFPSESINALKELKLLSAYVPKSQGGMGLDIIQIAKICEILGHYCGSSAMIYSMHMIQVACVVNHSGKSEYFKAYIKKLVAEQRLMASATTEIGVGGDLRSSICAVELNGDSFKLDKKAPVISYGVDADDLMITARRNPDAAKSDQVHVLLQKDQYTLEQISGWDTLGFRGTCSSGFNVTSSGSTEQILPVPFADILSQTMHPFAHLTWASLWSGIAADAVNIARASVKKAALQNIEMPPISAIRLGEVDSVLQTMRNNITVALEEYHHLLQQNDANAFTNFGFGIRINNIKIASSQLIVDIVGQAMLITGISSYRNDSKISLSRHIRDAYGTVLMVNNDRIMLHNSTLLLMHKEDT